MQQVSKIKSLKALISANGKHNTARHGDVDLKRVKDLNKIPAEDKLIVLPTNVVQEGEATGHHHTIQAKNASSQVLVLANADNPSQKYVAVEGEAVISHQEHDTIPLEAGLWEVAIEREYDPFTKVKRKVVD